MIEIKRVGIEEDSPERLTSFEGSPHDLILDFITLRKAIESNQKLKILWSLAELMVDEVDTKRETLIDRVRSTDDEDFKA